MQNYTYLIASNKFITPSNGHKIGDKIDQIMQQKIMLDDAKIKNDLQSDIEKIMRKHKIIEITKIDLDDRSTINYTLDDLST